jgi:hypothetical protein
VLRKIPSVVVHFLEPRSARRNALSGKGTSDFARESPAGSTAALRAWSLHSRADASAGVPGLPGQVSRRRSSHWGFKRPRRYALIHYPLASDFMAAFMKGQSAARQALCHANARQDCSDRQRDRALPKWHNSNKCQGLPRRIAADPVSEAWQTLRAQTHAEQPRESECNQDALDSSSSQR